MGGEWFLEMPLPFLSTEVDPGKLREEEGVPLVKTTKVQLRQLRPAGRRKWRRKLIHLGQLC